MDFSKKEIHTSVLKTSKCSQLTIDDDFNIHDQKEDIDKVIAKCGNAVVDEIYTEEGRVRVLGTVYFKVLYKTPSKDKEIEAFEGEILFEDVINVEGVSKEDYAECHCKLEDITVTIINSRKIEIRGLIQNCVNIHQDVRANVAIDLVNGKGIECQYKKATMTETIIAKRDMFKIREEVDIPQNKPNVQEVLWSYVALRNTDVKSLNDKIMVRGEIEIFILYKANESHLPMQYLYLVRTFSKEVDCQGVVEGMIVSVEANLGKGDVVVKQDEDGEDRIFGVDYNVDLNIRVYEDKEECFISDIYSPQVEIIPEKEEFICENILMKNLAKAKVSVKNKVDETKDKILQICHTFGNVDIDDIRVNSENVEIVGVVRTCILYISSGKDPICMMELNVPFDYVADTVPLSDEDSVRVNPSLDQLSANMLNSEEVEVKAQINLDICVFERGNIDVITDMQVHPIDYEKKSKMPGIVAYVAKKDDTIWSVARKYYATTESIRTINNLESDYINEGDRLIIVKS
ncbi:MAG: DUF3794 domain-containing protein [Lachnospiraceae bacterium]|nr:DUF3794 domain-containing protein [Lachnospiraceae bacterium]